MNYLISSISDLATADLLLKHKEKMLVFAKTKSEVDQINEEISDLRTCCNRFIKANTEDKAIKSYWVTPSR